MNGEPKNTTPERRVRHHRMGAIVTGIAALVVGNHIANPDSTPRPADKAVVVVENQDSGTGSFNGKVSDVNRYSPVEVKSAAPAATVVAEVMQSAPVPAAAEVVISASAPSVAEQSSPVAVDASQDTIANESEDTLVDVVEDPGYQIAPEAPAVDSEAPVVQDAPSDWETGLPPVPVTGEPAPAEVSIIDPPLRPQEGEMPAIVDQSAPAPPLRPEI